MNPLTFAPARSPRPVAQTRLLVVRPARSEIAEHPWRDFPQLLVPGDVCVVNDAATIPASIVGATANGEALEIRLLGTPNAARECDAVLFGAGDWRTPTEDRAAAPSVALGDVIVFAGFEATVVAVRENQRIRARFGRDRDEVLAAIYRAGKPVQYAHMRAPLALWDVQNSYASEPWAAEMPSAGRALDFATLDALRHRGVSVVRLTHAAGLSSIGSGAIDASLPWVERYRIPEETADAVRCAQADRKRVVAIGTSVVRALESSARAHGHVKAEEAQTDLRIDARHTLAVATGLLTGMHDSTTSHAELLAAFAPSELLASAAEKAVALGFLGHELGDSCLILDA